MLQRQIVFKQLQAMQQRQQLQELSDARQQHYLNQLSVLNRHTSGLQSSSMNGMPIQDSSQMFLGANVHLTQRGTPPIVQGFSNGYVFSQSQNQPIYSMGLPQQLDPSFYGTLVANSGNDVNAFSYIQGASHDSVNLLNTGNNSQLEMPLMRPSFLSNSFVNEPFNPPVDKVCMTNGGFVQKNLGDKNFYGQLFMQPSEDRVLPANFQQPDSLQKNTLVKEPAMKQEQAGWPLLAAGKTLRLEPSPDATSLDPLEEKILFNTDDNSWESSLGQHNNPVTVGFESTRQHCDFMGSFSANPSGSWSALMQSAVAEASSSDTGQQEEWSGLTFQNPELSADNDQANYVCDGQHRNWVDNNFQSISSPFSKPEVVFHHSNMNYSCSTEESDHLVTGQKEGMHSGFLQESTQQFSKNVTKWFDYNCQQKLPVEGFQLVQNSPPPQCVWHDQHHAHSKNDCRQLNISSCSMDSHPYSSLTGHELKAEAWQHGNVPQHMVDGSRRSSDEAPHSWSNEEQGYVEQVNYVDNIADIGMNLEKVHSPDTVASSQVPQVENRNDISSSSQNIQLRMVPPSQQVPISFSFPLQAHSNVVNTSCPWYQNNQLQYQHHSVTSVVNQSPCASRLLDTDRAQAKIAPSREPCDLFCTGIEDSIYNKKDNASGTGHEQHYGTMQNGQMLPISDLMHKITAAKQLCNGKSVENFQVIHSIGQVVPSNASQVRSILLNSDIKKVPAEQLSGDTLQNLAVVKPKKRKFAVFDLLPWHKEVTQSLQPLHKFSSSMAESEWALASNRLSEKVADEAMMEDIFPSSQAKKRLVLTTKLMQQVFRPAPGVILSADAWSNSESGIYFVAKLALGDACSLASGSHKPPFTSNLSSKELGTSERVGVLDFSKAVENFNDRAKKLENDLLRMDKAASVLEITVDSQELEKFSVINRFAKFHSKGQGSTSVYASSASHANPATPKAGTQRYVVAHPMPKVVPEGVNCISL